MEILYIRIDEIVSYADDKPEFKNQLELNLNANYIFEFSEKNNHVDLHYMKKIPNNFFGKTIKNISCIVGNNGSGKSTYIDLLSSYLTDNINNVIIISLENDNLVVYQSCKSDVKFNFGRNYNIKSIADFLVKTKIIYYSNQFEEKHYLSRRFNENLIDISTIGIMNSIEEGKTIDKIETFFYKEFEKQVEYLSCIQSRTNKNMPFQIPKYVEIHFIDSEYRLEIFKKTNEDNFLSFIETFRKFYNSYKSKSNNYDENILDLSKKHIFETKIVSQIIISLLSNFHDTIISQKSNEVFVKDFLTKFMANHYDDKNKILEKTIIMLKELREQLESYNEMKSIEISPFIDFLTFLNEGYDDYLNVGGVNRGLFRINMNEDSAKELIKLYFSIKTSHGFLRFKWGLSSGENTLLSIYSRLSSIKNLKTGEHIIILMDEIDNTLHPQWQQQIIKNFIDIFPDLLKCNSIQIIIATHSPIIISDIPKGNITFLEEKSIKDCSQHTETFSANIANLYYDSFFMKKGSTGLFATDKINKLIKAMVFVDGNKKIQYSSLKKMREELNVESNDEIEMLINLIGEPVVKNKILSMYQECKRTEKQV